MSDEDPKFIRPLGVQMYVEKIRPLKSESGALHLPESFDFRFSAKMKHDAIPDFFLAKVLAVGPEERSGLQPGDHTFVWSYAEHSKLRTDTSAGLMTGESVGEKNRFFINGTKNLYRDKPDEKCDHLNVVVDL